MPEDDSLLTMTAAVSTLGWETPVEPDAWPECKTTESGIVIGASRPLEPTKTGLPEDAHSTEREEIDPSRLVPHESPPWASATTSSEVGPAHTKTLVRTTHTSKHSAALNATESDPAESS